MAYQIIIILKDSAVDRLPDALRTQIINGIRTIKNANPTLIYDVKLNEDDNLTPDI